jgi:hypothetical protein
VRMTVRRVMAVIVRAVRMTVRMIMMLSVPLGALVSTCHPLSDP